MTDIDAARNLGARPGQQLHDTIDLPGWDHRSIWGHDDGVPSFYVQLWRSGSTADSQTSGSAASTRSTRGLPASHSPSSKRPDTTRWP